MYYVFNKIVIYSKSLEDKTARMRKDYEERLQTLAESKRQALREMTNMYESKLEEKDLILQEVIYFHLFNNFKCNMKHS